MFVEFLGPSQELKAEVKDILDVFEKEIPATISLKIGKLKNLKLKWNAKTSKLFNTKIDELIKFSAITAGEKPVFPDKKAYPNDFEIAAKEAFNALDLWYKEKRVVEANSIPADEKLIRINRELERILRSLEYKLPVYNTPKVQYMFKEDRAFKNPVADVAKDDEKYFTGICQASKQMIDYEDEKRFAVVSKIKVTAEPAVTAEIPVKKSPGRPKAVNIDKKTITQQMPD